jgi:hypothetical protein
MLASLPIDAFLVLDLAPTNIRRVMFGAMFGFLVSFGIALFHQRKGRRK